MLRPTYFIMQNHNNIIVNCTIIFCTKFPETRVDTGFQAIALLAQAFTQTK
jgi:hypothetical protein